jgi:SsrA-binding protein
MPEKKSQSRQIANNRKARYNYALEEEVEAGIVLLGTEVKALRTGKINIEDAYAVVKEGELWLLNCFIDVFAQGNRFNHEPRRPRKLLLHKRQIGKFQGRLKNKGYTLVPTSLYFNGKGMAKIKIALAHGKKEYEKRETIKKRDWEREKSSLMKRRH